MITYTKGTLMNIDMGNLRAFCVVAEKESFTLAAELLGATQSTISMRVKKLEQLLGQKLFDSSPHGVELTDFGAEFITKAKDLLGAHDNTLQEITHKSEKQGFRIGITYHLSNIYLPKILKVARTDFSQYRLAVGVGSSEDLYAGLARTKYDAIIVKRLVDDHTGIVLSKGDVVWMASKDFQYDGTNPLPLVSLSAPCWLRQLAINALNAEKIVWQETFIGTDAFIVGSALSQNFGAACLERHNMPADCMVLPDSLGFPSIPDTENVLEATSVAKRRHVPLLEAIAGLFDNND